MEKFIPYDKLSKKERRNRDLKKRGDWGTMSPVTRRKESGKLYNRKKTRDVRWPDEPGVPRIFYSLFSSRSSETMLLTASI